MKVYKTVRRHNGKLYSALYHSLPADWLIEYTPGWPAVPRRGRIFAFEELHQAQTFADIRKLEVWVAEGDDPIPVCSVADTMCHALDFVIFARRVWRTTDWQRYFDLATGYVAAPAGTLGVTSLTLIRRVE
jgi:hypothetical protein